MLSIRSSEKGLECKGLISNTRFRIIPLFRAVDLGTIVAQNRAMIAKWRDLWEAREREGERQRNNASISPRSGNDHDYDRSRFNRRYFTSIFTILRRGPLLTSLYIPNHHPLDFFFFSIPLRSLASFPQIGIKFPESIYNTNLFE